MGRISRVLHLNHPRHPGKARKGVAALVAAAVLSAGGGAALADPHFTAEAAGGTEAAAKVIFHDAFNEGAGILDHYVSVYHYRLHEGDVRQLHKLAARFPDSAGERKATQVLWEHTHQPMRLQVISPGVQVSGTVIRVDQPPMSPNVPGGDGDISYDLKLDPEYAGLAENPHFTNNGTIHIEVVCGNRVTDKDSLRACSNFKNPVQDLSEVKVGTHLNVAGAYVYDRNHGDMEIHPVAYLTVRSLATGS